MRTLLLLLLLLQAPWFWQSSFNKLPDGTQKSLQKMAENFDVTRNPRIQAALLREDLEWMQRGYSDRQIDFTVLVVLELSVPRAKRLLEDTEYLEGLGGNKEAVIARIESYLDLVPLEIEKLTKRFKDRPLKSYELKFYY